jgi:hypothetical protein
LGAVYQLVEGLEGKYFSASGEEELLHVFTAHAEPASGDAGYDFKSVETGGNGHALEMLTYADSLFTEQASFYLL